MRFHSYTKLPQGTVDGISCWWDIWVYYQVVPTSEMFVGTSRLWPSEDFTSKCLLLWRGSLNIIPYHTSKMNNKMVHDTSETDVYTRLYKYYWQWCIDPCSHSFHMVDQPRENNTTYPDSKPKQCCQMTSVDVLLLSATLKNMLSIIIMKTLSNDTWGKHQTSIVWCWSVANWDQCDVRPRAVDGHCGCSQ